MHADIAWQRTVDRHTQLNGKAHSWRLCVRPASVHAADGISAGSSKGNNPSWMAKALGFGGRMTSSFFSADGRPDGRSPGLRRP